VSNTSSGDLNDLWKYNPITNRWTWISGDKTIYQVGVYGTKGIAAAANKPGARMGAVSWIDVADNLWLMGGHGMAASTVSGFLNDLWKYNPSTKRWMWVSGDNVVSDRFDINQLGVYGTKGLPNAANKP